MRRLLAVLLAAGAAGGCGNASADLAARSHTRSGSNRAAAARDARSLLASLRLPPGALRSATEPRGDGGVLARPFSGPPVTPNAVEDHAWWVIRASPESVIGYIRTHPPPGSTAGMSGSVTLARHGQTALSAIGFQWPARPGVLSSRSLAVEAARLSNGSTGVRADSEVVWITPRPATERVPAGARSVVITTTRFGKVTQGPITVRSPSAIRRVEALLNALPAFTPGTSACPADLGILIRLAFYRAAGAAPLAVAMIDPTGCGEVQLTIRGRRQRPLVGGFTLTRRLDRVLGLKLDTGVR